jgi:hypothetical protein
MCFFLTVSWVREATHTNNVPQATFCCAALLLPLQPLVDGSRPYAQIPYS